MRSIKEFVDAYNNGQQTVHSFRKTPVPATTAGVWTDLSMAPGNPGANYYASTPLESAEVELSFYHGGAVSPATKYLSELLALTASANGVPLTLRLCDYLLYYPFIDMSDTSEQAMINTVSLPRYIDGNGVKLMVVEVASQVGGSTFTINYTNSNGVAGRVTPVHTCNAVTTTGTIVTSATATNGCVGPFVTLQAGDIGVRSVESITFLTPDVGLVTLVLVKPLAQINIRETTAPAEVNYLKDKAQAPIIEDGAKLNFIACPAASLASVSIYGILSTVWS